MKMSTIKPIADSVKHTCDVYQSAVIRGASSEELENLKAAYKIACDNFTKLFYPNRMN
jgi:hypothetical protein